LKRAGGQKKAGGHSKPFISHKDNVCAARTVNAKGRQDGGRICGSIGLGSAKANSLFGLHDAGVSDFSQFSSAAGLIYLLIFGQKIHKIRLKFSSGSSRRPQAAFRGS
jgi:hypothetical protein